MAYIGGYTQAQFAVFLTDLITPLLQDVKSSNKEEVADLREKLKNSTKRLMTLKDVIEHFSISKPTVYAWIELGTLISYPVNGRIYFKAEDIYKLTADRLKK